MAWTYIVILAMLLNLLPIAPLVQTVFAVGGDFKTTDFAAAAPFTYNHATGGGAYNDRTVGDYNDITEQLEGAQFTCGDTVTYLAHIEMEDTTVEAVQSAQMSFTFLANSTGQAGAAHAEVVGVSINYGPVENGDDGTGTNPGAGFFGLDSGISDDGGSNVTIDSTGLTGPLFGKDSELLLTVTVDDLEAGEKVVLRIDTRLACDPGSAPTGNLQAQLDTVIALPSGDAASSGAQTIPFLRVGDIFGAGEPVLQITKTVAPATGTCGVDDVEELTVTQGDTVKYCYSVTNPGTGDLYDVEMIDDNGTEATSDDFSVSLSGLQDLDGDADLGDLASGETIYGEALVTLNIAKTVINLATASGNNNLTGGNYADLTDEDTATVVVEGVPNQPPVAVDDSFGGTEDSLIVGNVLPDNGGGADYDPDGNLNSDSVTLVSGPSDGTLTLNGDGTFSYEPNDNFSGTDSFVYEVCDTEGLCDQATVTLTVSAVNDAPIANDDSYSTAEDTPLTVPAPGVLDNDSDVEGDALFVDSYTQPANGTVVQNPDGSLTYTPDENFNGTDTYEYTISDGNGGSDTATVTIVVSGVNDAPDAVDDSASVDEDGSVDIPVLGNDSDPDGDELTVTDVTDPANGSVTINEDGTLTYTPDPDFCGQDSFVYTISDGNGGTDTATVTVDVSCVNDAPVANDDSGTTPEDTPITIDAAANDTDVDGNLVPSSATVVSGPSNGSVENNGDGTFTYTPNPDFNGSDSFDYQICDTDGACDTATVTINVTPVNDAPVANDDSASVGEDGSVDIPVLSNDSDPDGDNLTITDISDPTNGSVVINPDGTVTYTPDPDFCGQDSFDYTISDGNGGTDTAAVTVGVACVNDAPVANDDSGTTPEDTPITIDAAANDTDVDGNLDPSSATLVSGPANGAVVNNGDGTFTYTPNADFNSSDSFDYQICDTDGACDTATVTINVTPVQDAPDAQDDSASVEEDGSVDVPVLDNDSDPDGDPLTVTEVSDPPNGTATLNPNGTITYTPDPDFCGQDSFSYTINDGNGGTDTATVTVDVTCVNDAPVANDDSDSTDEDVPVTIPVLDNDSDVDGDSLTVVEVSDPANGSVTINADGTVTYTPDPDYNGEDTFTYTISDGNGGTDTATVTVIIGALNDPPVADDDSVTTAEDTPVSINAAANDYDVDGNLDPSTTTVLTGPIHGDLVNNGDGTFSYTPDPNYNGPDSFTYQICDTDGLCDMATVNITVTPVNDAPVANDDSYNATEDTPLTIDAPGILGNDTDVDGDALTVVDYTQPSNGSLVQNVDGSFAYTPNADWCGTDSYDYTISDGNGGSDAATVTIDVACVNDAPVAVDDAYSTDEDTLLTIAAPGILVNDSDEDGDGLFVDSYTQPANGTLTQNEDGSLTYEPNANWSGVDTYEYTISDGNGGSDTATVTITVNPVNDAPVANDDSYNTNEDTPLTIAAPGILGNDSDVETDALTVVDFTQPSNGTLTQNADGSFTYTPDENWNGTDSYTYTISDGNGGSDTATVTIDVTGVNDAPVAVDDAYSTDEDTLLTIAAPGILGNDSDVDGDSLFVDSYTQPANGTLTQNEDGSFSYEPNADWHGVDTYEYTISDGNGGSDTATVTITVNPVNDAPVAVDDSYNATEDTPLTIDAPGILGNDSDADGDAFTVTSFTQPANGTLEQNVDGSFSYTPNADFYGTDSYDYTISDGNGGSDTATVTILVEGVNDAPVAVDDAYSTDEDTPLTVGAPGTLGNDSDVDGDELFVDSYTQPANGTLTQSADGSLTYVPNANWNGVDTYEYTISDGNGGSDTATVTITVNPVNDPPVALDDAYTTQQDTTLVVSAEEGVLWQGDDDFDIDGDAIYVDYYDATSAYGGSISMNADGSFSYTPDAGFAGYDTFTYTITDGNGEFATATVIITVEARNNRSISVDLQAFELGVDRQSLGGYLVITNQSDGYDVQINDLAIEVQYRLPTGGGWIANQVVEGTCSFDPSPNFQVIDQHGVSFSGCELAEEIHEDATVRVTALVKIFGRIKGKGKADSWFLNRLSQ